MRRGPAVLVVVLAAALVGLLAYGVAQGGEDRSIARALEAGERSPAPASTQGLAVLGGSGETGSISDHRGKVVVLNVWASWCDPCKDELPLLERTHRRITPRGGTVLGLNVRDVSTEALGLVREFGLTFPSLRDRDAEVTRAFGTPKYPETYVLDRRGRVAAHNIGPVDQAWLDAKLRPLLAERA